jgi:hypothetical protein
LATAPEAPSTFWTTMVRPRSFSRHVDTTRATVSVGPPADVPTMTVIVPVG